MKVVTIKCDCCYKIKTDDAGNGDWLQTVGGDESITISVHIHGGGIGLQDFCGIDCLISTVRKITAKVMEARAEMEAQDKAMDRA